MPPGLRPRFTVIGAGLSGALMATYLGRAGYQVDVYEQRPDPRGGKVLAGRSVSLPISTRGIYALRQVGVAEKVLEAAVPMRGRMIHPARGAPWFQPYGKDSREVIHSVSALALNIALLNAAQRCLNVEVHFDRKCVNVDLDNARAELVNTVNRTTASSDGDILVGADGPFSVVRHRMQRLDRFNYSQDYLEHGYKELTIPRGADGRRLLDQDALHIWPRRPFFMTALADFNGSFTCTLFGPCQGERSFGGLRTKQNVLRFFNEQFADAAPLMPTLAEDFQRRPTGSLLTIRCGPWSYRDKVVLLGGACHTTVPFDGAGVDAVFEDCMVLNECMVKYVANWELVFAEYYRLRKKHVDALAELAITDFMELTGHVSSGRFRAKAKAERMLQRITLGRFAPLHSLVAFTQVPYAEAIRRVRKRRRTIRIIGATIMALLMVALGWAIRR